MFDCNFICKEYVLFEFCTGILTHSELIILDLIYPMLVTDGVQNASSHNLAEYTLAERMFIIWQGCKVSSVFLLFCS